MDGANLALGDLNGAATLAALRVALEVMLVASSAVPVSRQYTLNASATLAEPTLHAAAHHAAANHQHGHHLAPRLAHTLAHAALAAHGVRVNTDGATALPASFVLREHEVAAHAAIPIAPDRFRNSRGLALLSRCTSVAAQAIIDEVLKAAIDADVDAGVDGAGVGAGGGPGAGIGGAGLSAGIDDAGVVLAAVPASVLLLVLAIMVPKLLVRHRLRRRWP